MPMLKRIRVPTRAEYIRHLHRSLPFELRDRLHSQFFPEREMRSQPSDESEPQRLAGSMWNRQREKL